MKGLTALLQREYKKKDSEKGASYETKSHFLRVLNESAIPGMNMYAGTVPHETKMRRRAKNKAARKARRINR